DLAPGRGPLLEREDRGQGVAPRPLDPAAAREIVDDGDLVAFLREPHRCRPSQIPVAAEYQYTHEAGRVAETSVGSAMPPRLFLALAVLFLRRRRVVLLLRALLRRRCGGRRRRRRRQGRYRNQPGAVVARPRGALELERADIAS